MSHRKFEKPRHGSLAFLPRKRSRYGRGRVKAWPKNDTSVPPHLAGFIGYKAGNTHVVRLIQRNGSKFDECEVVERVTIVETPPMVAVGVVGYRRTPTGLKTLTKTFTGALSENFKRNYFKSYFKAKKAKFGAFTKLEEASAKKVLEQRLKRIAQFADEVRVIMHTQNYKIPVLGQKKAHVLEIKVNGGKDIAEQVEFAKGLLEQETPVTAVFAEGESIDCIGNTKGHGRQGVVKRWGVKCLPRKSHRGYRKVACIGPWHPARVSWTVARQGQLGFHHRTIRGCRIYRVGEPAESCANGNASTEADPTKKHITPLGGFPNYGTVKHNFLMIKGNIPGAKKKPVILRKACRPVRSAKHNEPIGLRFIDTSSKFGRGRFQTVAEKGRFFGPTKKQKVAVEAPAEKQ